jgi:hypothetical protein
MKWSEAAAFSRAIRQHTGQCVSFRSYMLLFGGGTAGLVGLAGLVGYVGYGTNPGWALLWWALGLGLALGSLSYLVSEQVPAVIRLKDTGIERQSFRGINVYLERWHWADVAYCRLMRVEEGGRSFNVLAVYSPSGECVPLGLRRSARADAIQEWFEARKRPLQQYGSAQSPPLSELLAHPFAPSATEEASLGG